MENANENIELKIQTELSRQIFIKIEILDIYNNIIKEVSGSAIGGNYNIDNSSDVRRTCSIIFNLDQGYLPDESSVFWLNKKFNLYVGLKQLDSDEPYWFNKGIYAIKDPSISISISENTITISGLDKTALYNGDISGQLPYSTMIEVGNDTETPYAHEALRTIMTDGGETNLLISNTNLKIPYKIESSISDTIWDLVNKITELFYDYKAFYNVDGYFVFTKKPSYQSNGDIQNQIVMNFSEEYKNSQISTTPHNLIIDIKRDIAYSNIKNKIVIYGGMHDDGYQPSYEIIVDDAHYPTSQYTIEKLGEKYPDDSPMYRIFVVQDDNYIDTITDFILYDSTLNNKMTFVYNQCIKYNNSYYKCINENGSDNITAPNIKTTDWKFICTSEQLEKSRDDDAKLFNAESNYVVGDIVYTITNNNTNTKAYYACIQNCTGGVSVDNTSYWLSIKRLSEYMADIHAYSIDLCRQRTEQEVYLHQQATDTISLVCVPIYSLDVDDVIYIKDSKSGIDGEYVINNISCGLSASDTMSITANKLW